VRAVGGVSARAAKLFRQLAQRAGSVVDAVAQTLGLPVKWADVRQTVLAFVGLLRLGPWGVLALALLLVTLVGFGTVLSAPGEERGRLLGTPAASGLLGAVAAYAFAVLISEVRRFPPLLRLAAGAYALWYLLLPPVMVLPRWAALAPAWVLYLVEAGRLAADRRSRLWVVPWAVLLARLSAPAVWPLWASVSVGALVYTACGWILMRLVPAGIAAERPLLFGSMAAVYLWGLARDPAHFAGALRGGYEALFTFLGLFWMWLAADLVDDASEIAERAVHRLRGVFGRRALAYGVAASLAAVGGAAALVAAAPTLVDALPEAAAAAVVRLFRDQWDTGIVLCGLLLCGAGVLALWRLARSGDATSVASDVVASAVVVGLVYLGARQAWSEATEADVPEGWWPLLVAALPLVVEEVKQVGKGLRAGPAALLTAAVGLLGVAATAFKLAQEPEAALRATTLYPFLGMLLWGLPHLVARMGAGWQAEVRSAAFFLTGYLTALPAALVVPKLELGSPALAVLLWPLVLAAARLELPAEPQERLAAGLLLASGALAFYYAPLYVPVPFVPWTQTLLRRLSETHAPELMGWGQLVAWAGAAVSGVLFALGGRRGGWVAALLWAGWNRWLLR